MPQEHNVREAAEGNGSGRVLTVTVRPRLSDVKIPLSFYCSTENAATGYGRISLAFNEAMGLRWVALGMRPDIVLDIPGSVAFEKVRFTMWEASELPPEVTGFMHAKALIVPCRHNVRVFRNAGYKGNIHVVPLWGEAAASSLPSSGPFRFICVARENGVPQRKGMPQLVECFKRAFYGNKDVRLTLKRSPTCSRFDPNDERITVITEDISKRDYESMISSHHCGIFLSGLEGWNLPACELMASGRPSIIIPYGGPADFTTEETSWHLEYSMVRAPSCYPYNGAGFGAKAHDDSVIAAMREAVSDWPLLQKKSAACIEASKQYTKALFIKRLRGAITESLGRC